MRLIIVLTAVAMMRAAEAALAADVLPPQPTLAGGFKPGDKVMVREGNFEYPGEVIADPLFPPSDKTAVPSGVLIVKFMKAGKEETRRFFGGSPALRLVAAPGKADPGVTPSAATVDPNGEISTPQEIIKKNGAIEVPGLGGMKFLPNGDILGSDGKKVFDGATRKWAEGTFPAAAGQATAAAGVPEVRIGETLEQCVSRFGEGKPQPPYVVFENSGWRIVVAFYRGRIDHITYRKELGKAAEYTTGKLYDLVENAEPDLVAVRQLQGENRKWIESGADAKVLRRGGANTIIASYRPTAAELVDTKTLILPKISWRSPEGLLHHTYAIDDSADVLSKSITVSTQANRARRDGSSDSIKMNRDDARAAWELGASITRLSGASPSKAQEGLREAAGLFASLRGAQAARVADPKLAAWDPPAATGNATKDKQALDKFLAQTSERVLKALGSDDQQADEPAVAACFDLGRNTPLFLIILLTGDAKLKTDFLDQYATIAGRSNLPKTIWEPVLQKARAGAPATEVTRATQKMYFEVTRYLDGKKAEWKPQTKPGEK